RGTGARAAQGSHGCVIAQYEIEHMSQKLRVGGGRPQRLRADSAFGQKKAQPLGLGGNEGQRLNCNDFSYFARVVNRLFQQAVCLSVTLWSLVCRLSCPSLRNVF